MTKLQPRRVPTRRLDLSQRVRSFAEIELGYTLAEARAEAERCLHCPAQPCVAACPGGNSVPTFLAALRDGRLEEGVLALRQTSSFPAICSRVCDHPRQCEGACVVARRGEPVAIGRLERFLGDWEQAMGLRPREPGHSTWRRAAVVGAGPCGMAAAALLAERGHEVHLYDSLPAIGGVLAWGIPAFRLPAEVLEVEVARLLALGVTFHGKARLGRDLGLDELFLRGCQAVLLATGAPCPTLLDIPGSQLRGVHTATAVLSAAKLYGERRSGRRVVVIGGGNTAMDAAQTALRLGAEEVTVLYRRSRAELPARHEEVDLVEEEGVRFQFLVAPVRFVADAQGHLASVSCCRMELGAPGPDGRRTPVPVPEDPFDLPADMVVLATGYGPDPHLRDELHGVLLDKRGYIQADPSTGRTSRLGVWAGGDAATGPDTVVSAMAWGRRAASDMDHFLRDEAHVDGLPGGRAG
ncbi:MAG: NAD(P)-dependent oxidoreductase [Chloroflexi bacterium]|nr:NAD(P)-dependent oxidoreductase [Chloroflexota bacterium]